MHIDKEHSNINKGNNECHADSDLNNYNHQNNTVNIDNDYCEGGDGGLGGDDLYPDTSSGHSVYKCHVCGLNCETFDFLNEHLNEHCQDIFYLSTNPSSQLTVGTTATSTSTMAAAVDGTSVETGGGGDGGAAAANSHSSSSCQMLYFNNDTNNSIDILNTLLLMHNSDADENSDCFSLSEKVLYKCFIEKFNQSGSGAADQEQQQQQQQQADQLEDDDGNCCINIIEYAPNSNEDHHQNGGFSIITTTGTGTGGVYGDSNGLATIQFDNDSPDGLTIIQQSSSQQQLQYHQPSRSNMSNSRQNNHRQPRVHQCDICNRVFKKSNDLLRHRRIHTLERPYQCPLCPKSFAVKCALDNHSRTHLDLPKTYKCDICNLNYSYKASLDLHKRLHTGYKPFECNLCSQFFRTSSLYKTHMLNKHSILLKRQRQIVQSNTNELSSSSSISTTATTTKTAANDNWNTESPSTSNNNLNTEFLLCENINKTNTMTNEDGYLVGDDNLNNHATSANDAATTTSKIVNSTNDYHHHHHHSQANDLQQHQVDILMFQFDQEYDLEQVNDESSQATNEYDVLDCRQSNLATVTTNAPATANCSNIGISSSSSAFIGNEQNQPDQLHHCAASSSSYSLPKNSRKSRKINVIIRDIENGINPNEHNAENSTNFYSGDNGCFKCDKCQSVFSSHHDLYEHVTKKNSCKTNICHACGKPFTKPCELKRHLRIHTGEKPFECPIEGCGKAFNQKNALYTHMRIHNGSKPYRCNYCDFACTQNGNLQVNHLISF